MMTRYWLLVVMGMVIGGCDRQSALPFPLVSGQVVGADGKPLPEGQVVFVPDTAAGDGGIHRPAGPIRDGRYELYTLGRKGVPPGRYRVLVVSLDSTAPIPDTSPPQFRSRIPSRYNDPSQSTLRAEIGPEIGPVTCDLRIDP